MRQSRTEVNFRHLLQPPPSPPANRVEKMWMARHNVLLTGNRIEILLSSLYIDWVAPLVFTHSTSAASKQKSHGSGVFKFKYIKKPF